MIHDFKRTISEARILGKIVKRYVNGIYTLKSCLLALSGQIKISFSALLPWTRECLLEVLKIAAK